MGILPVDCFGIPSVMSTSFLMHATHRLASFGSISVPHSAHKLDLIGV